MGVLQTIIATAGSTGGGGGGGPPPYVGTDFFYAGDQNNWIAFGGLQSGSIFSNPAPANPSYTYPDGSTGKTRDFTGTEWMISANLGFGGAWVPNGTSISINLWFYPTANNCQIMSELGTQDPGSGYHYSILEIDSSGYVKAKFWQNGAINTHQVVTSNNTVILNQWNHIYFAEDTQGGHIFELNGVGTTGLPTYFRLSPGSSNEYFAIGLSDATYMVTSNPFQGKIGYLQISDYVATSTYATNFNRFKVINTGMALGTDWTIEIIAEFLPTTFWATVWGNESYTAGQGHLAFFNSTSNLEVGSPLGTNSYNVIGIDAKGYWAFVHENGSGLNLYRNGVLVTPNITGYLQPLLASNTLLLGSRHNNDGTGYSDPMTGNYYYYNVTSTPLDATNILASYNALKTTYGLP